MTFLYGAQSLWNYYHKERRDIDRRFPAASTPPEGVEFVDHWDNVAIMRNAARAELRASVKHAIASGYGGPYPIPV